MPSFYHFTFDSYRSVCPPGAGPVPACAYLSSEDSIRGAAASLIGSEVPASIESAAALDRDGRVARRKRSTLQVVRVTCLAARVWRDAAALALGGRVHSSQGACAAERQSGMGLLDLVLLCSRRWRRLVGLLLLLLLLLLPLARRVVRGLLLLFDNFRRSTG